MTEISTTVSAAEVGAVGALALPDCQDLLNRLRRAEGQIRGVVSMIEQGQDCDKVVAQVAAAKSALSRASAMLIVRLSGDDKPSGLSSADVDRLAMQLS